MPASEGAPRGHELPDPPDRAGLCETLVELASDHIAVFDAESRIVYRNVAAEVAFGPATGRLSLEWVHPDDVAAMAAASAELRARPGGNATVRCRLRRVDGSWMVGEAVGVNLLDAPQVRGTVWITRDVTERVALERERERLLAGERLVADLGLRSLRGADEADLLRDALAGLREVLRADHVHLLDVEVDGLRVREAVGDRPVPRGLFLPAACVEETPAGVSLAQRAPVVVADLASDPSVTASPTLRELGVVSSLVVLLDGPTGAMGVLAAHTVTPREFGEGEVAVAQSVANVLAGVAAASQREGEARHQALHDPLTGLANRAHLQDRLVDALRRSERQGSEVALVFIDLDGFKAVNDTHGHEAGDAVLVDVADRLRAVFRSAHTLARLGGDEFVAVCCDFQGEPEAVRMRSRIAAIWEAPVVVPSADGEPLRVPVRGSIGIATGRGGDTDARGLLARADGEMYRAKRALRRDGGGR